MSIQSNSGWLWLTGPILQLPMVSFLFHTAVSDVRPNSIFIRIFLVVAGGGDSDPTADVWWRAGDETSGAWHQARSSRSSPVRSGSAPPWRTGAITNQPTDERHYLRVREVILFLALVRKKHRFPPRDNERRRNLAVRFRFRWRRACARSVSVVA